MKSRAELLHFMRRTPHWVEATTARDGAPQAAVIGVAVSDALELYFDTFGDTRKCVNLRRDARMALVMWAGDATVQLEGVADEPTGAELVALKQVYFGTFADGPSRESWPGLAYVRVRPTWIRYADFGAGGPHIFTFDGAALSALR